MPSMLSHLKMVRAVIVGYQDLSLRQDDRQLRKKVLKKFAFISVHLRKNQSLFSRAFNISP